MRARALLFALGSLAAANALAVFPRAKDANGNPINANETAFPYVGMFGGASGVAIDTRWVLSAQHINGSVFTLPGFGDFNVVQNIEPAIVNGVRPDLRLLQVDRDLPGFYRVDTRSVVGQAVTLVGFGGSGDEFPDGTSGYDLNQPAGFRRSATNRIEGYEDISFSSTPPYEPYWTTMFYNLSAPGDPTRTAREGGIYSGDSGGGWLYNFGEGFHLVATSSAIDGPNGTSNFGAYGATGYGTYLGSPESKAFLRQYVPQAVVPEPASLTALGLASLALLRRRRK